MDNYKTIEADVLVVGGGGAGARAAIEADKKGVRVVLADKGPIGMSGVTGQAGSNLALGQRVGREYSPEANEKRFIECVQGGYYLGDQNLAWLWISEEVDRKKEITSWGSPIHPSADGRDYTATGQWTMNALKREVERHPNIYLLEYGVVTKLLTHERKITGATVFDLKSGDLILVKTKAVVMATGGLGQVYYPSECLQLGMMCGDTGDGHVLAYHAGAEITDMEFFHFSTNGHRPRWMEHTRHVMAAFAPGKIRRGGYRIGANGRGPYYDEDGNVLITTKEVTSVPFRCLPRTGGGYNPYVGLTLWQEMRKGKTLYINIAERKDESTPMPADKVLGVNEENMDEWGLDKVEICFGPLTTSGGLWVNERCEATVPGLYAAGEAMGNLYGTFRGAGYEEVLIFGKIAGEYAAKYAEQAEQGPIDVGAVEEEQERINGFLEPKGNGISPVEVRKKIWELTGKYLKLERDEKILKRALTEIEEIRKKDLPRVQAANIRRMNVEWLAAIELPFMLESAEMVARAALFRTESRGHHDRRDFPEHDNANWLYHTLIKREDDRMTFSKKSIIMTRIKPPTNMKKWEVAGDAVPVR